MSAASKTTQRATRKRKTGKMLPTLVTLAALTAAATAAPTGATGGDVDKALGECPGMASRYRVAALHLHPDKNPAADAEEKFVALSNAYQKKAAACARAGESTKRPKGPRTAKHKSRRRKTASPRERAAEVEEMRRRHAAMMDDEEQARREREEGPPQQEEGGGGWGRASKTAGVLAAVAAAQGAYALNRRRQPTYRRGRRPRTPDRQSRSRQPRWRGGKRRRRKKKTRRRRRKRRRVSTRRRKLRQSGGGYFAPQNTPAPNLPEYRWSVPS